ncbi:sn-glycerol-3-phosphate ABC transporter ATP-binding protein UgpC [uncultured Lactobacillus sp.]|uniref:ABC transporter ATP-binding protein n=1 Tax=uncultured Lactobacillus sp. TaxID=153152 RepID=UPI0026667AC5|nr:sn-glycerol-3-phosphate ABC transporter ATP-binding protein UgpC [uncultured Lactobacillus sp.]
MVQIDLKHVYKKYDKAQNYSVTDFNLHINDEEFIVFVGPSGCGKSTTLRMIAGLEDISKGDLVIGGKRMNDLPPKDRDIAMVFQNYALYPHMSVYDNMAFGLKIRKTPKDVIDKKIKDAAKVLGLTEYLKRKPADLSGGQRQRVALGRAIVRDAPIFLMDEPLSNLDAKLRVSMRAEIAKIHRKLKTTTIYVTHDQTEAMTLADRIVILKDGKIQQVGTPKEVYNSPANVFVGGFIGSPAMNFSKVTLNGNQVIANNGAFKFTLPEGRLKMLRDKGYEGKELVMGIRPEDIHSEQMFLETFPDSVVNAEVVVSELLGAETQLYTKIGEMEVICKVDSRDFVKPGATIKLGFDMNKAHFFDPETEVNLDLE